MLIRVYCWPTCSIIIAFCTVVTLSRRWSGGGHLPKTGTIRRVTFPRCRTFPGCRAPAAWRQPIVRWWSLSCARWSGLRQGRQFLPQTITRRGICLSSIRSRIICKCIILYLQIQLIAYWQLVKYGNVTDDIICKIPTWEFPVRT